MEPMPAFDLTRVPFSRSGSYLVLAGPFRSPETSPLFLRSAHGAPRESRESLRIELLRDGKSLPFKSQANASLLRAQADGAALEACMPRPGQVLFRGQGAGVRLSVPDPKAFGLAFPLSSGAWLINCWATRSKYVLTVLRGRLEADCPWNRVKCDSVRLDVLPDESGRLLFALEECMTAPHVWQGEDNFDHAVREVEREFRAFLGRLPKVPSRYAAARALAAYLLWSCTVEPRENLRRRGILMSKNWMTDIWSWDHCFNAMALAGADHELAWDQLLLMFDAQDEHGALPDSLSDRSAVWNFCKPPIHGWALRHMLRAGRKLKTAARLREIYGPLSRWTEWWLRWRDTDGDGIPQYEHGNDSGWDNATCFDLLPPVEGPDLSAYLVVQMDVLSALARKLGQAAAAARWKARADALLKTFLAHSWRGSHFVAPQDTTHAVAAGGDSLLPYLPLVLGRRLPKEIAAALVAGLVRPGRFLTPHGLATECPQSPLYEPDGYWRGPIWAPPTMILWSGLRDLGEERLAATLARAFCDTCARSGFAENFNALTGEPLRDKAYTWTASVFLMLAHELRGTT